MRPVFAFSQLTMKRRNQNRKQKQSLQCTIGRKYEKDAFQTTSGIWCIGRCADWQRLHWVLISFPGSIILCWLNAWSIKRRNYLAADADAAETREDHPPVCSLLSHPGRQYSVDPPNFRWILCLDIQKSRWSENRNGESSVPRRTFHLPACISVKQFGLSEQTPPWWKLDLFNSGEFWFKHAIEHKRDTNLISRRLGINRDIHLSWFRSTGAHLVFFHSRGDILSGGWTNDWRKVLCLFVLSILAEQNEVAAKVLQTHPCHKCLWTNSKVWLGTSWSTKRFDFCSNSARSKIFNWNTKCSVMHSHAGADRFLQKSCEWLCMALEALMGLWVLFTHKSGISRNTSQIYGHLQIPLVFDASHPAFSFGRCASMLISNGWTLGVLSAAFVLCPAIASPCHCFRSRSSELDFRWLVSGDALITLNAGCLLIQMGEVVCVEFQAQSIQDAGHDAQRNATQRNASKWDLLMWMGVSTLHTSNIKGKTF